MMTRYGMDYWLVGLVEVLMIVLMIVLIMALMKSITTLLQFMKIQL